MFKLIASLSFAAMTLVLASAASAKSSCEETADTNYAIAVAIDYADADMVHENTMHDCEEYDAPVESTPAAEAMLDSVLAMLLR